MTDFKKDVLTGLSAEEKYISSRYFYNATGDQLFQKIMELDEYYLTRTEFEILERNAEKIISHVQAPFHLVELGAGDGLKTKILLDEITTEKLAFTYLPVDISQHALDNLMKDLSTKYPGLDGRPIRDDYFNALGQINGVAHQKMVMFLGSNIGNFTRDVAGNFLSELRENLHAGDKLLLGVDLKKDPQVIRSAYNDSKGITSAFNLNLLTRINEELDGNFDLDLFEHAPTYDPTTGSARSYIRSRADQQVEVADQVFHFKKGELMFTEISQKYDCEELEQMAEGAGFTVEEVFTDDQEYFVDAIWKAT